jgi:hypothetical protein
MYCCKLFLNTLWGKLAERDNRKQTQIIKANEMVKLEALMSNPSIALTNFHILSEEMMIVEFVTRWDSAIGTCQSRNVFLGAFTTSHARLKLYELLESIGDDKIIYFDTDSAIYKVRDGEDEPALADYLGDLTDELNDDNAETKDYIEEFCTTGPKSYAYRTMKEKVVCKCKGIRLDHTSAQTVNFKTMMDIVTENPNKTVDVDCGVQITRDKLKSILVNRPLTKKFRMVYTKRARLEGYDTLPYGY